MISHLNTGQKNKNFLTLKKNCTSIDLYAVMADQYEELDYERKTRVISESDNIITLKRRKIGSTVIYVYFLFSS